MNSSKPELIRVSKSCLSAAEKKAVMGVLDREYLGMGAEVQQFEQALAGFFGRPAVCVVNGTAALHLAVQACGIGPGDEVLVPSLTYVASFQAVSATGAKPVACDIDPQTCILDWRDAERRLTSRTKAILPVHYSGGAGELDHIYALAKRHGLRVIEDAAHALGSTYGGQRVGGFGDIACFSFDGIKNITSGEGGCVVTDDPSVLSKIQDARLLGVERDTEKRYTGQRTWEFDASLQGWRYHMSNLMAAIGLEQLKRLPAMAATRQRLARLYEERLRDHPRIRPLLRDYNAVVPHIYVVRILGMPDRKALRAQLLEKGIQTGVHYQPNHMLALYRDPAALPLPVTDAVFPELLTLPLHPDVSEQDVERVCEELKALLQGQAESIPRHAGTATPVPRHHELRVERPEERAGAPAARLLVVGGSGFIGRHVVHHALELGWDVTSLGLSRRHGGPEDLPGVRYVSADIADGDALREALEGASFEYMVNCGGYVDHTLFADGGHAIVDVHFKGVLNLIQIVNRDALRSFVSIGTCDAYGNNPAPQNETQREAPISPYALAKVAAAHLLQTLHRTENFPAITLRLFLTYGPGQDDRRFVPQIIRGCLAGGPFPASRGEQVRDLCFIQDSVDAVFAALATPAANGEVINIGSGRPLSILEVIETVQRLIGQGEPRFGEIAYRPGENMKLYADISKARALLGWEPKVNLETGLEKTIQWIRDRS